MKKLAVKGIGKEPVLEPPSEVLPMRRYINSLLDKANEKQLGIILQFIKRMMKV